jgi:hypothetical protein
MLSTRALCWIAGVMLASTTCAPQPHGPDSAANRGAAELSAADRFPTSLHARGPSNGRENVYEDGPGRLTKVPFRYLPCQTCHPETYADGTPVDEASYRPGCKDCHVDPLTPRQMEELMKDYSE